LEGNRCKGRATGAANVTDIGSGSDGSLRWYRVCLWVVGCVVELAVVVTHSGILCVPY